jgi:hypothetical protein
MKGVARNDLSYIFIVDSNLPLSTQSSRIAAANRVQDAGFILEFASDLVFLDPHPSNAMF